ncbi:hypothetical protein GPS45_16165 [Acinetobacter haemolyticus]|uniref:tautomerase family protein n=1 Tax=Acinetobacter haemolyticus TaxID=29430 RepID=UPI001372C0E0|nr:tautomerase family protein [Acinetobacter haemolyticus]NAR90989.1 hypothetical protein [Acinetobacter haemolyticus]
MPYILIQVTKEGVTTAQKQQLIRGATDLLVNEPYRVCRRPLFLRECPDEKSKIHP